MVSKQGLVWLIGICLFPIITYANNLPDAQTACVLLGSNPSFIVKLNNVSSKKIPKLPNWLLQRFSSTKATFTSVKPMSDDAFILFFTPEKSLLADQVKPGCYTFATIENLTNDLKSKSAIKYISPNILMRPAQMKGLLPIPVVGVKQWNLLTPPGGINAQLAFNQTTGKSSVITAVVDGGILSNASLAPNLLTGVTFNSNGSFALGAATSCDSTCSDYDHGTHVAGIVAASGALAYTETIFGVAPTATVLPVNVFTKFTNVSFCSPGTSPCLLSYTADQLNALNWLAGENFTGLPTAPYVATVNLSLSSFGGCTLQTAIDQLLAKNITIAIAAGDNNFDASFFAPGNCSGVMTVAATGRTGFGAFYSNFGNSVSFAAPGGDETAAVTDGIYSTIENAYGYKQGTSMASSHAAGLSALLYSLDPTLTPATVLSILQNTALPFPTGGSGLNCTVTEPCGTGIINAPAAVTATMAQAPVLYFTANPLVTVDTDNQATVTWQAAWLPANATAILYTVNLNGVNVPSCTNQTATSCVLPGLSTSTPYTVYVTATDVRSIYTPIQSAAQAFNTAIAPPVLIVAARNPLLPSQAFIYYSTVGAPEADVLILNGLPSGATLQLNASQKRFVVDNITTPKFVSSIYLVGVYAGVLRASNSISLPSIL